MVSNEKSIGNTYHERSDEIDSDSFTFALYIEWSQFHSLGVHLCHCFPFGNKNVIDLFLHSFGRFVPFVDTVVESVASVNIKNEIIQLESKCKHFQAIYLFV